jgi:hypothetical protein
MRLIPALALLAFAQPSLAETVDCRVDAAKVRTTRGYVPATEFEGKPYRAAFEAGRLTLTGENRIPAEFACDAAKTPLTCTRENDVVEYDAARGVLVRNLSVEGGAALSIVLLCGRQGG